MFDKRVDMRDRYLNGGNLVQFSTLSFKSYDPYFRSFRSLIEVTKQTKKLTLVKLYIEKLDPIECIGLGSSGNKNKLHSCYHYNPKPEYIPF